MQFFSKMIKLFLTDFSTRFDNMGDEIQGALVLRFAVKRQGDHWQNLKKLWDMEIRYMQSFFQIGVKNKWKLQDLIVFKLWLNKTLFKVKKTPEFLKEFKII